MGLSPVPASCLPPRVTSKQARCVTYQSCKPPVGYAQQNSGEPSQVCGGGTSNLVTYEETSLNSTQLRIRSRSPRGPKPMYAACYRNRARYSHDNPPDAPTPGLDQLRYVDHLPGIYIASLIPSHLIQMHPIPPWVSDGNASLARQNAEKLKKTCQTPKTLIALEPGGVPSLSCRGVPFPWTPTKGGGAPEHRTTEG